MVSVDHVYLLTSPPSLISLMVSVDGKHHVYLLEVVVVGGGGGEETKLVHLRIYTRVGVLGRLDSWGDSKL